LPASVIARPDTLDNYRAYPLLLAVPVAVLLALAGIRYFSRKSDDRKAFACSCAYLTVMLVGAAIAMYPRLLPSSTDPTRDITIQKALSGPHTLRVGLVWWSLGMCLALTYFVIVYRMFRGKVSLESRATSIESGIENNYAPACDKRKSLLLVPFRHYSRLLALSNSLKLPPAASNTLEWRERVGFWYMVSDARRILPCSAA